MRDDKRPREVETALAQQVACLGAQTLTLRSDNARKVGSMVPIDRSAWSALNAEESFWSATMKVRRRRAAFAEQVALPRNPCGARLTVEGMPWEPSPWFEVQIQRKRRSSPGDRMDHQPFLAGSPLGLLSDVLAGPEVRRNCAPRNGFCPFENGCVPKEMIKRLDFGKLRGS